MQSRREQKLSGTQTAANHALNKKAYLLKGKFSKEPEVGIVPHKLLLETSLKAQIQVFHEHI